MNATWTDRQTDRQTVRAVSLSTCPFIHSFISFSGIPLLNSQIEQNKNSSNLTKRISIHLYFTDTDVALDVPVPSEEEERNMKRK